MLCLIEDSPTIFHKSLTGRRAVTTENKLEAWRESALRGSSHRGRPQKEMERFEIGDFKCCAR